jgi:hypothetical protein
MKHIRIADIKKLKLKLNFRNETALHDAIIVKLLNLGFTKESGITLKPKKDFMIFCDKGKFRTSLKDWVYSNQYKPITLDDLYTLNRLIPEPTTNPTVADIMHFGCLIRHTDDCTIRTIPFSLQCSCGASELQAKL